ncbi:MAG: glycerol-3-phosphate cytidylyltransferase, partial [Candidatus Roizmanbacteria bacterium]|nr:glycerol-3-phosphate cytidylyltransferase [Candidatus Roizmanbacteria bacterium]
EDYDYFKLVEKIRPDVIAITKDDPQTENKKRQAALINAQVIEVSPLIRPYSTTLLINEL